LRGSRNLHDSVHNPTTPPSALSRPKLSIICTGRNDDRAPDQYERLVSLQRTIAHALRNVSFEFLFIEWNPDPGVAYLGEALFLDQARHYVVTREAHKRLVADAAMSTRDGKVVKSDRAFLLNHANNVGMKHATGEWILITNLDDLFPAEFGELFEKGESGALALGIHPHWSYNLLVRYRRAQRSTAWKRTKATVAWLRRAAKSTLRVATFPLRLARRGARLVKRAVRFALGPGIYPLRHALMPVKYRLRLNASRARYQLRRLIIHLLGGAAEPRPKTLPWWKRLARSRLIRALASSELAVLIGGALLLIVAVLRHPIRTARSVRQALRRRWFLVRQAARHRGRKFVRNIYGFFFDPRVNWQVGRVKLRPGTLYRVRRQHVSDTFACRGAQAASIEQYMHDVETEAVPGPWNNHFPWTWACGDFLLMDYATWEKIGGFPQQIGQLHADSVTIFRIVAEGCRVALLDWNIYHMDHDDRFDSVPYVEYDFENVQRYFGPGWTKVESMLIERANRLAPRMPGNGATADSFLVESTQPVAIGEESR
jgi:hypothetical protein